MEEFDEKQKRLINSWRQMAYINTDVYMSFIAEWIAFNAICYNLYRRRAIGSRVDLAKKEQVNKIEYLLTDGPIIVKEAKIERNENKIKVEIDEPGKLSLRIAKKFTEDLIYKQYVIEYDRWYEENYSNQKNETFKNLQQALKKTVQDGAKSFVINMSMVEQYDSSKTFKELSSKNIIVPCETNCLETIKRVLYQVRCNIFHGEKTPGELNDDRIVQAALPLLQIIVQKLVNDHQIS